MDYNNPDRPLLPEEKRYVRKMSELLNRAKRTNRWDIVEEFGDLSNIQNKTQLKNKYYQLAEMEKTIPDNVPEKHTNTISQQNAGEEKINVAEKSSGNSSSGDASKVVSYDPMLQATPIQRDYTGAGQNIQGTEREIPEPNAFNSATEQPGAAAEGSSAGGPNGGPASGRGDQLGGERPIQGAGSNEEPFSQGAGDGAGADSVPDGEKDRSSRLLAKTAVEMYSEYIPKLFTAMSTLSENKILTLQQTGQIDFNIRVTIPVPEPHESTIGAYVNECNEKAKGIYQLDPEFKRDLTDATAAYLKTKSWGVKPGELLLMMVGQHLAMCATQAMQINKMMKANLESFIIITKGERKSDSPISPDSISNIDNEEPEATSGNTEHFDTAEIIGKGR